LQNLEHMIQISCNFLTGRKNFPRFYIVDAAQPDFDTPPPAPLRIYTTSLVCNTTLIFD
jgi:hypothetical protein